MNELLNIPTTNRYSTIQQGYTIPYTPEELAHIDQIVTTETLFGN